MRNAYETSEGRNVLENKLVIDLQNMAENLGIDTKKMVTHTTRRGWENQGKVLLQVLCESGWIDASCVSKYKMGVVDEYG